MKTYGYVRVSSTDQNEDRQLQAMEQRAVSEKDIFIDKISGKDFVRPQYRKMQRKLKKGIYFISRVLIDLEGTLTRYSKSGLI